MLHEGGSVNQTILANLFNGQEIYILKYKTSGLALIYFIIIVLFS